MVDVPSRLLYAWGAVSIFAAYSAPGGTYHEWVTVIMAGTLPLLSTVVGRRGDEQLDGAACVFVAAL
jgi:hypothetical protein